MRRTVVINGFEREQEYVVMEWQRSYLPFNWPVGYEFSAGFAGLAPMEYKVEGYVEIEGQSFVQVGQWQAVAESLGELNAGKAE